MEERYLPNTCVVEISDEIVHAILIGLKSIPQFGDLGRKISKD